MEIRQLRYFVHVVRSGSMGRAAIELNVVTSALSQQISRLESELSVRLLKRSKNGVQPTSAGLALWHKAQLILRMTDDAARAAQSGRLSGEAAVGLAPSTSGVLALPFLHEMKSRYPEIAVRIIENLSGNLESLLSSRQIDVAIIFGAAKSKRVQTVPLFIEQLYSISAHVLPAPADPRGYDISELAAFRLILPSSPHGLRSLLDAAFARDGRVANVEAEIDGLGTLMQAVSVGMGVTIQPAAALERCNGATLHTVPILAATLSRTNFVGSLADDELTPSGLAARLVLAEVALKLIRERRWAGVTALT
ncbi:LysR family transcriptional regulator [Burkholderia multivorans]|uniref:LysR substrate-binding domain-containing protein n=1 Tax=Burkholderia multivorans TaxID=87883 RepID=UPI001C217348|nr:LysR substrate-binding domain-containing protein [Burkholderia multivorans]MBU9366611.1 LysR family transcriptional regulator [Burkholderia multivorans]MBU9597123.1 LysR family transcriptional regulator [Burkholderia multivorans]MCA8487932.1 LysR family transcriptional regulator [Burkholderia multivorans]